MIRFTVSIEFIRTMLTSIENVSFKNKCNMEEGTKERWLKNKDKNKDFKEMWGENSKISNIIEIVLIQCKILRILTTKEDLNRKDNTWTIENRIMLIHPSIIRVKILSTINWRTPNLMQTIEQNSNKIKEISHKPLKLMTFYINSYNKNHTKKT